MTVVGAALGGGFGLIASAAPVGSKPFPVSVRLKATAVGATVGGIIVGGAGLAARAGAHPALVTAGAAIAGGVVGQSPPPSQLVGAVLGAGLGAAAGGAAAYYCRPHRAAALVAPVRAIAVRKGIAVAAVAA